MTSGKKVIGAGPANPVTIVDATANLEKAARDIVRGASFDNNLMCTSEKCMVVEESVSDRFIYELLKNGVYYIRNEAEIQKLLNAAVTEDFVINKKLEGRSAKEILEYAGIPASKAIKLIVAETGRMHPFVITELMMPLVDVYKRQGLFRYSFRLKPTDILFHRDVLTSTCIRIWRQTEIFPKNLHRNW